MKNKNSIPDYYPLVYEIVSLIPFGRVSTYGHIADYLSLGSARMVGWALNQTHKINTYNIPVHRVVNRIGELSGRHHFKPPSAMQKMLEDEDVKIENNRVKDFKNKLWIPANNL